MYRDATPGLGNYQFSTARFSGRQNLECAVRVLIDRVITYLTSPRTGHQHKASGVSPRIEIANVSKPAERASAVNGMRWFFLAKAT